MKQVFQCAVTLAILMSTASSQIIQTTTNPITLVRKATYRLAYADFSNDVPIHIQWATRGAVYTYQWDFDANYFSEELRTNTSLIYARDVTRNSSAIFEGGRCRYEVDRTNWS